MVDMIEKKAANRNGGVQYRNGAGRRTRKGNLTPSSNSRRRAPPLGR